MGNKAKNTNKETTTSETPKEGETYRSTADRHAP